MSSKEPPPRWAHFSAAVEDHVVLYGGSISTRHFWRDKSATTSKVHLFDPYLESWCEAATQGPPPPGHGFNQGACASSGHNFYTFGGQAAHEVEWHGSLHQLNINTLTWSTLPTTSTAGPMGKSGCKMISHDDQLLLFGGYGAPSGPTQPGAEFLKDTRFPSYDNGWTNELHTFCLKGGE